MERQFVELPITDKLVINGPAGAIVSDGPVIDIRKGNAYQIGIYPSDGNKEWIENYKRFAHEHGKLKEVVEDAPDRLIYIRDGYDGPEYAFFLVKQVGNGRFLMISNDTQSHLPRDEDHINWVIESVETLRVKDESSARVPVIE